MEFCTTENSFLSLQWFSSRVGLALARHKVYFHYRARNAKPLPCLSIALVGQNWLDSAILLDAVLCVCVCTWKWSNRKDREREKERKPENDGLGFSIRLNVRLIELDFQYSLLSFYFFALKLAHKTFFLLVRFVFSFIRFARSGVSLSLPLLSLLLCRWFSAPSVSAFSCMVKHEQITKIFLQKMNRFGHHLPHACDSFHFSFGNLDIDVAASTQPPPPPPLPSPPASSPSPSSNFCFSFTRRRSRRRHCLHNISPFGGKAVPLWIVAVAVAVVVFAFIAIVVVVPRAANSPLHFILKLMSMPRLTLLSHRNLKLKICHDLFNFLVCLHSVAVLIAIVYTYLYTNSVYTMSSRTVAAQWFVFLFLSVHCIRFILSFIR